MGFLIFSAARTIFLSFIYALAHCRKVKNLMNTLHTVSCHFQLEPSVGTQLTSLPDFPRLINHLLDRLGCSDPPNVGIRRMPE